MQSGDWQSKNPNPEPEFISTLRFKTRGSRESLSTGMAPSAPIPEITDNLRIMISWFSKNPGRRWKLLHEIPGLVFAGKKPPGAIHIKHLRCF
jgi:hypothetical protein